VDGVLPDDHSVVVKPTLSPWKFNFPGQLRCTVANAYKVHKLPTSSTQRMLIEQIIVDG